MFSVQAKGGGGGYGESYDDQAYGNEPAASAEPDEVW